MCLFPVRYRLLPVLETGETALTVRPGLVNCLKKATLQLRQRGCRFLLRTHPVFSHLTGIVPCVLLRPL